MARSRLLRGLDALPPGKLQEIERTLTLILA
jgi:hypothetical protein